MAYRFSPGDCRKNCRECIGCCNNQAPITWTVTLPWGQVVTADFYQVLSSPTGCEWRASNITYDCIGFPGGPFTDGEIQVTATVQADDVNGELQVALYRRIDPSTTSGPNYSWSVAFPFRPYCGSTHHLRENVGDCPPTGDCLLSANSCCGCSCEEPSTPIECVQCTTADGTLATHVQVDVAGSLACPSINGTYIVPYWRPMSWGWCDSPQLIGGCGYFLITPDPSGGPVDSVRVFVQIVTRLNPIQGYFTDVYIHLGYESGLGGHVIGWEGVNLSVAGPSAELLPCTPIDEIMLHGGGFCKSVCAPTSVRVRTL